MGGKKGECNRKSFVKDYLNKLGYTVNDNALSVIKQCDDWYANRMIDDFHEQENLNGVKCRLHRLNFAKRCCADDANLCEIISVSPDKEDLSKDFIDTFLKQNRFDVRYREQLEKVSAVGTAGAYCYLQNATFLRNGDGTVSVTGGNIRISYCEADGIIPLAVENRLVTECAFTGTDIVNGKEKTTLVLFTRKHGLYQADTIFFDEYGRHIRSEDISVQLGEVKPFSVMTNAEVNNLDNMEGYGLPKIYNSIPLFKAVDLCYNILYGDLDKGQKLVFINELLACIKEDKEGNRYLTPQQKKLFVMLGNRLPHQDVLVKEYNPEIRVEQITKIFELVLSLLSMQFGYGSKKYTFENGQIKTATEYIGTKQDAMQELNKQRKQATDYITDLIKAGLWFSNAFSGTAYPLDEGLSIEFDDSYVEDKATKLEAMRTDAISFPEVPWLKFMYLKEKYNLSDAEAKKYIDEGSSWEDDLNDEGDISDKTDLSQAAEKGLNGAQTQSLIAIMGQFASGALSEGQAVNLISKSIGTTKADAKAILNGEMDQEG